jgi:hypothetical protein
MIKNAVFDNKVPKQCLHRPGQTLGFQGVGGSQNF